MAIGLCSDSGNVYLRKLGNFVRCQVLRSFKYLVGDRFGCWTSIREVILDAEIVFGTCKVCDQPVKDKVIG